MAKVEALEYHTHAGKAYDAGDTYDVDDAAVENLVVQGKAKVSAGVTRAKALKATKTGKLKPAKPAKALKTKASKKK